MVRLALGCQSRGWGGVGEGTLAGTYVFDVGGFEPAEDPRQLVHRGEGGALDPHGLKPAGEEHSQTDDQLVHNYKQC